MTWAFNPKLKTEWHFYVDTTKSTIAGMVKTITGSYKLKYHPDSKSSKEVIIDFTPPFKRISMIEGLENKIGVKFPKDLDSKGTCYLIFCFVFPQQNLRKKCN